MVILPQSNRRLITFLLTLAIVSACLLSSDSATAAQGGSPNNYSTKFALAENSISENGKWLSGKTVGLDWSNIQTSPGLAIGTQDGNGNHDDSVAVLSGKWASDQTVQATANVQNRVGVQKVGLFLRTSIAAHNITGYEVSFSVGNSNSVQILRWNGPINDSKPLNSSANFKVSDGDVVKASVSGSTITVFLNGKQVLQATDTSFSSGAPGMGFSIASGGANANFGLSNFTATAQATAAATAAASSGGTYTTNFPLTENPISEGGNWINGGTTGLKWVNVRTSPGFAFGTESGSVNFDDSTAILTGSWSADQSAEARVSVRHADSGVFEEVEIRLRSTISANVNKGYEINCSVVPGNPYMQIVRWNGAFGSWTLLDARDVGCSNGDTLKATASGSTITAYKNGNAVFSVHDGTFTSGSPGIGFYLSGGGSSLNANFGFSSFTATGGTGSSGPTAPTGLNATPH